MASSLIWLALSLKESISQHICNRETADGGKIDVVLIKRNNSSVMGVSDVYVFHNCCSCWFDVSYKQVYFRLNLI